MTLITPTSRSLGLAVTLFLLAVPLYLAPTHAQQTLSPAQKQTTETGSVNLTAKSANVAESGVPVKVSILRWSTDEERTRVVIALGPVAQAAAQAVAAAGGRGAGGARGGRGGARGDRGAAAGLDPNDPALADLDGTPAQAREGRGGARGGRGDAAPAKPVDPIV